MPRVCATGPHQGWPPDPYSPNVLRYINDGIDDWKNIKSAKEHDEKSGLKPIQDKDGNVMMHHWSSEKGIEVLDPGKQGEMKSGTGQTVGLRGSNFRQGRPAIPYISFGLNVGHPEGYVKEQGLGDVEYIAEIPFEKIYDLRADPLSLRVERDKIIQEQKISPMDMKSKNDIMSKLIRDEGYAGFFVSNGAGYGLTAAIWESVAVEQLGPRNKEAVAKASTSKFENMKEGWGLTTQHIEDYKNNSEKIDYKQKVVLRKLANKKIAKNPKINLDEDYEWASAVIKNSQIETLGKVQKIPTFREIIAGVGKKVAGKLIRQGGGQGYVRINNGTEVKARLDIPAYTRTNTWVVTVHTATSPMKVIGYAKSAVLEDVKFDEFSNAAKRVAAGIDKKSTFATMRGKWLDVNETQAEEMANQALASVDWVEIGMNPNRYGYFYIKETGQRILTSPQVIQVGPLVMANMKGASIKETPHSELLANPEKKLFHAQSNKSTGEIEYRESNTASVLEELSRQPGELGHMSRYLKGIGVQHSLRSKKAKRNQDGISLGGSTKWTPVGITVDPREVGKNNKFDNLYDLLVALGEDPKGPAAQYNHKLSDEQSIRMERAWIRKTGEDWQGRETSVEEFNDYL